MKTNFTVSLRFCWACLCLLPVVSSQAAFDAFMRFGSPQHGAVAFTGDSSDTQFPGSEGWVPIQSFDEGILNTINLGSAGGSSPNGEPQFKALTLEKNVGPGSPALFATCVIGGQYDDVELALRTPAPTCSATPFYTARMRRVFVKSILWQGRSGEDLPVESVAMAYGQIEWTYTQIGANGEVVDSQTVHWDLLSNTGGTGPLPGSNHPPTIQCPANIVTSTAAGRCSAMVNFIVTVNDDNETPAVVCTPASGATFPKGTTTVNCTATDAAGLTASGCFAVTVNDTENPTVTKGSIAACYPDVASAEAAAIAATSVSDNCSAVTKSASTVGTCSAVITVRGTDGSDHYAEVSYDTRIDNQRPVLAGCPKDASFPCLADVPAPANVTANDYCDGALKPRFSESRSGDVCSGLTITRTWTVSDTCGIPASCRQTITVQDTTVPTVEAWPADVILTCADCNIDPSNTGLPIGVADTCANPPEVSKEDTTVIDGCPKVVKRTWTVADGCNRLTHVQTITCLPTCVITDGALCIFDRDPATTDQRDFRLVFAQDPQNWPCDKLTSSNPGKFSYNVFALGAPGNTLALSITLPYPFVTQGSSPIHAYDWVTVTARPDDSVCFVPGETLPVTLLAGQTPVTLESYGVDLTCSFTIQVTVPASGFVSVNAQLDYGLKGRSACTRNANNDAVDCATATQILIPDGAVYGFGVRGSANGTDSVRSHNVFKKNPGAGGLCLSSACADPVPGVKVTLKNSKGQVLVTGLSDEDGWYLFNYKWAGKPSTFYVTLKTTTDYTETKTIILKANAYAQVDFLVP